MNPITGYSIKAAGGFRSGQMSPPVTRKVFPPMLIVEGYTDGIEGILQRALMFVNTLFFNKQSFVYHLKQMRWNYVRFLKQRYNRNRSGTLCSDFTNIFQEPMMKWVPSCFTTIFIPSWSAVNWLAL